MARDSSLLDEGSIPEERGRGYTALVDGYNVIKRHPAWTRLPPAEGRQRLKEHLLAVRWPIPVVDMVAVFDAPSTSMQRVASTLRICFAAPSADRWLQDAVRTNRTPERLLVISDDREILTTAKQHGARCHSTIWLLDRRRTTPAPRPHGGRISPAKNLSAGEARNITEELERRWLGP